MLKNYFLVACKVYMRRKLFTAINLLCHYPYSGGLTDSRRDVADHVLSLWCGRQE